MIVRISTEGQYKLDSSHLDKLNELDNRIVNVVAIGDEKQFEQLYSEMVSLVRQQGKPVKYEELLESQIILPPPDITIEDAKELFKGSGLIPD
ncbi:MAG: hypothetical protein M1343_11815 [Chloroflexi bacterium]|nr:hypothetical protein [Chloroflexota bacterium]MDA8189164.1 hypothetical protein [Dehalococcoidales bacterium]